MLKKHTILQAKEWKLIGGLRRLSFREQHHQMEGVQIARCGLGWGEPLHSLTAVTKRFAQPEGVGRFQAAASQALTDFFDSSAAGIGENSQRVWSLLQSPH